MIDLDTKNDATLDSEFRYYNFPIFAKYSAINDNFILAELQSNKFYILDEKLDLILSILQKKNKHISNIIGLCTTIKKASK